jgi:hypothetical protein
MIAQLTILIFLVSMLVRRFRSRNMPRVGGKLGRIRSIDPPQPRPVGFSRIYARAATVFVASEAPRFSTLKAFLRDSVIRQPVVMQIYRVAGCKAEIEIADRAADYERLDAAEALALLRELPDPRIIRRLHLSDEPSFLDPWLRQVKGKELFFQGNATNFGLVVLYRPDRRLGESLRITLLHEWLHLVAFASRFQLWRFKRANAIEPLPPLAIDPLNFGDRKTRVYEAWSDLGEQLLGYDEAAARHAALALPVHTMILWRCVERMLGKTPLDLRSTRFDVLMTRGEFMHAEVEPKARALRAMHAFWSISR